MSKKRTVATKKRKRGVFTVRGEALTSGVRDKLSYAVQCNKKIIVQSITLFPEVLDIVAKSGAAEFQVVLDKKHAALEDDSKELQYGT